MKSIHMIYMTAVHIRSLSEPKESYLGRSHSDQDRIVGNYRKKMINDVLMPLSKGTQKTMAPKCFQYNRAIIFL